MQQVCHLGKKMNCTPLLLCKQNNENPTAK